MLNVDNLLKEAIKSKNSINTSVIRELKSEILKFKSSKEQLPYTDEEEIKILRRMAKNRKDAILLFIESHRDDLESQYTSELEYIESLLPKSPKPEELRIFIESQLESSELLDLCINHKLPKSKMGYMINLVKSNFPTADGREISNLVKLYVV